MATARKTTKKPAAKKSSARKTPARQKLATTGAGGRAPRDLDPDTGKRTTVTPAMRKTFLQELATHANVGRACEAIKRSRWTMHQLKNKDEAFSKEWDEARQVGWGSVEDEAIRRGVTGYEEPIFYKGHQVSVVRRYSDALHNTLLAGNHGKYNKQRHEHSGPNGSPIQTAPVEIVVNGVKVTKE